MGELGAAGRLACCSPTFNAVWCVDAAAKNRRMTKLCQAPAGDQLKEGGGRNAWRRRPPFTPRLLESPPPCSFGRVRGDLPWPVITLPQVNLRVLADLADVADLADLAVAVDPARDGQISARSRVHHP